MKPIVHYKGAIGPIVVGRSATVFPVDHYNTTLVSNKKHAFTSTVVSYDQETGKFETQNTQYVPVTLS